MLGRMQSRRARRTYDHRLIELVRETGDATIATRLGVPRSTAAGWAQRAPAAVVTAPTLDATIAELQVRVARLERRMRRLLAFLRILLALLRIVKPDLRYVRVPQATDKARLLRAIERSRDVLGLRRVLRIVGLSPSRLAAWQRAAVACELEDASSCPRASPQRLTFDEVSAVRELTTAAEFRHVPTGRLAVLAQRLGRVVASPMTWYRLVRKRGWRRPRLRVHPAAPREGLRATRANEIWSIDTTLVRLLDGSRAYIQAIIDSFSRRILAWRVSERFDPGATAALLVEAGRHLDADADAPMLLVDAGVENLNGAVDELVDAGRLRRVLARVDVTFSNSMIEAFWRSLKHGWLFLNRLDTVVAVQRLVAFYVAEHNGAIPHSALGGQTPDEMYFGTGAHVPAQLAAARVAARRRRLERNRAARCSVCSA
jgi:transposase InsO family protein